MTGAVGSCQLQDKLQSPCQWTRKPKTFFSMLTNFHLKKVLAHLTIHSFIDFAIYCEIVDHYSVCREKCQFLYKRQKRLGSSFGSQRKTMQCTGGSVSRHGALNSIRSQVYICISFLHDSAKLKFATNFTWVTLRLVSCGKALSYSKSTPWIKNHRCKL